MDLQFILNNISNFDFNNHLFRNDINTMIDRFVSNRSNLCKEDIVNLGLLLQISNILYANTSSDILLMSDGVYDSLHELYTAYTGNKVIGADPNIIINGLQNVAVPQTNSTDGMVTVNLSKKIDLSNPNYDNFINVMRDSSFRLYERFNDTGIISQRTRSVPHEYKELSGTLDKCKFVLINDAYEANPDNLNDPTVKIFERDFINKHIQAGVPIDQNNMALVVELKYDGVSVQSTVGSTIKTACTRGETATDKSSDYTPILGGYPFPNLIKSGCSDVDPSFGMQFEAIIDDYSLGMVNRLMGKEYSNPRTAISGILSRKDSAELARFIKLIPIKTTLSFTDRIEELEFMNKYYSNGELNRYTVIYGNKTSILYQLKMLMQDISNMRSSNLIPYAFDGIVVSYLDPNLVQCLGREGFVNKYQVAIKFTAREAITSVRGVTFTVGSNGVVVPKYNYDPIEFYGTIHTKSSGGSYGKFNKLNLRYGDYIRCIYVNDVMVQIYPAPEHMNRYNNNPYIEFTSVCPICGSTLEISDEGKGAYCKNMNCGGRAVARLQNCLVSLGFTKIGDVGVQDLGVTHLHQFLSMTLEELCSKLGNAIGTDVYGQIQQFKSTPIYDYQIVGSLGFANVAIEKFKKIFMHFGLNSLIDYSPMMLMGCMSTAVKGIAEKTITKIISDRDYLIDDLKYIRDNLIIIPYKDNSTMFASKVYFSGVKASKEEIGRLNSRGIEVAKSMTKKAIAIIVPHHGYSSSSVITATANQIPVMTYDEFINSKI